jgi:hypothetical protein
MAESARCSQVAAMGVDGEQGDADSISWTLQSSNPSTSFAPLRCSPASPRTDRAESNAPAAWPPVGRKAPPAFRYFSGSRVACRWRSRGSGPVQPHQT